MSAEVSVSNLLKLSHIICALARDVLGKDVEPDDVESLTAAVDALIDQGTLANAYGVAFMRHTRPKAVTNVWTTKDGRVTPVPEMGNSHLINTARMLMRNIPSDTRFSRWELGLLQGGVLPEMLKEIQARGIKDAPELAVFLEPGPCRHNGMTELSTRCNRCGERADAIAMERRLEELRRNTGANSREVGSRRRRRRR